MITLAHLKRVLVLVTSIVLLCFWNAQSKTFPLAGDAACFVPVAQSLALGKGLVNQYYSPPVPVDDKHPERFVWHGVVAPWIWFVAAPSGDFEDIRTAGIVVSSIGCLIFGLLLLRATSDLCWQCSIALVVAGMLGASGYFVHNGRPESVSCVIVCLGFWVLPKTNSYVWSLVCGCFLGGVAATTPTSALLLVPLICIYQVFRCEHARQLCVNLAITGAVTVLSILVVIHVAWIEPGLWISAMKLHAEKVVWSRTGGSLITYWIKDAAIPLLALTVTVQAACLLLGLHFWLQKPNRVRVKRFHKAVIFFAATVFICEVWTVVLKCPAMRYNLLPSLVVLAVAAVSVSAVCVGRGRSILFALLCISFSPGIIGFVRQFAVWKDAQSHSLTLREARKCLVQDLNKLNVLNSEVRIHSNLFELVNSVRDNGPDFKVTFDHETNAKVLVLPQANTGLLVPPEVKGFYLAVNRYDGFLPRLFGVRLANTPGGYNYAVYLRGSSSLADQ